MRPGASSPHAAPAAIELGAEARTAWTQRSGRPTIHAVTAEVTQVAEEPQRIRIGRGTGTVQVGEPLDLPATPEVSARIAGQVKLTIDVTVTRSAP